MRPPPPLSPRRFGVFTLAEALAAGWTYEALRHAVRTGRLERVRAGCFAVPLVGGSRFARADHLLARRSIAASLVTMNSHVSHLGAALVLGTPIWAPAARSCLLSSSGTTRAAGVHVHRVADHDGHVGRIGGVPVTSPGRTVVDVAREFGAESGLVVADAAARMRLLDRSLLDGTVSTFAGCRDIGAAQQVLAMVDPLAESPLESRSRWHIALDGLPPPWTQVRIHDRRGCFIGRTDFYWDEFGVVGEVDGSAKYQPGDVPGENPALVAEKWRQELLEDLDLEVVRWGSRALDDFAPTGVRLRRAMARGAARTGPRRWITVRSTTVWS